MKLTVAQILIVRKVLTQTNELGIDGKPVAKTYSGQDFLAFRWFMKNVEEILEKYNELLNKKKEEYNEKFKKELDLERNSIKKLKEYINNLDLSKEEGKKDKKVLELAEKVLQNNSVNIKMFAELGGDKELNKAFKEDKHEVEVRDKSLALLKREVESFEFGIDDTEIDEVLEQILDGEKK